MTMRTKRQRRNTWEFVVRRKGALPKPLYPTFSARRPLRAEEAVFVLHCFQKKSKSGIATPKEDIEIIRARLKVAEAIAKEMRDGKAHR